MTHDHEIDDLFVEVLSAKSAVIHKDNVEKGFWDRGLERPKSETILLMITELTEMYEGIRGGNPPDKHCPDYTCEEIELADMFIRGMDYAFAHKLRLGDAINAKLMYNRTRPHKHGKLF